jgi:hypothetical protein
MFVLRYGAPMVLIQTADFLLGRQVTLWAFLLVPTGLAAWNYGRHEAAVAGGMALALMLTDAVYVGGPFATTQYALIAAINRCMALAGLIALVCHCRAVSIGRAARSIRKLDARKS